MKVVPFSVKKHYRIMASWYHSRDLSAPLPHMLPQVGFVVGGAAIGFLYQTDSCIALLDGFIGHPEVLPSRRRQAIKILAGALLDEASKRGFEEFLITTSAPSIGVIASEFGFRPVNQTMMMLSTSLEEQEGGDNG